MNPTIIASVVATVCAVLIIPTVLMLAPKNGVSGRLARDLITVGSTSVERRLNRAVAVLALACAVASLVVVAL